VNAWWQVDLGGFYDISAIEIWNRTDCCWDRLDDFYIFVSDVPFVSDDLGDILNQDGVWSIHITSIPYPDLQLWIGRVGRYVRIQLGDTNCLSLAEVKVFGEEVSEKDNIALGRAVVQSSTSGAGEAWRAVDGDINGNWLDSSVTHTYEEVNPWWQVDLGGLCAIDTVELWNRTDCCWDRLDDFYIFVSDVPFVSDDLTDTLNQDGVWSMHITNIPDPQVQLWVGQVGRYVRIQLGDTNYLSLAEVKVLGEMLVPQEDNVALGGVVDQSSTRWPGIAGRAVDGDTNGNWIDESVTHTYEEVNPWWQVDLGGFCDISSIEIWNRTDCCWDRLDDFYVFVSDVPFISEDLTDTLNQEGVWSMHITSIPYPDLQLWIGRIGRYVRIQLGDTNALSLAEVKVFGVAKSY
jgi:hypothetical protein